MVEAKVEPIKVKPSSDFLNSDVINRSSANSRLARKREASQCNDFDSRSDLKIFRTCRRIEWFPS
jgi:hypothetical protein